MPNFLEADTGIFKNVALKSESIIFNFFFLMEDDSAILIAFSVRNSLGNFQLVVWERGLLDK